MMKGLRQPIIVNIQPKSTNNTVRFSMKGSSFLLVIIREMKRAYGGRKGGLVPQRIVLCFRLGHQR